MLCQEIVWAGRGASLIMTLIVLKLGPNRKPSQLIGIHYQNTTLPFPWPTNSLSLQASSLGLTTQVITPYGESLIGESTGDLLTVRVAQKVACKEPASDLHLPNCCTTCRPRPKPREQFRRSFMLPPKQKKRHASW